MKDEIRKSKSLVSTTIQIKEDMKSVQAKYNDDVSELALITKAELKTFADNIKSNKISKDEIIKVENLFDRLEETLYRLDGTQGQMDEIVSLIGGLEFSTGHTENKLTEILNEQELQHSRMTKAINVMKTEVEELSEGNQEHIDHFKEDINEFLHDFSRYQDYVIASVPRIIALFDELDQEEARGLRYRDSV